MPIESKTFGDGQSTNITPIPIEDTAFKRMTMDVVGPIEPKSAAGHVCALWIHVQDGQQYTY